MIVMMITYATSAPLSDSLQASDRQRLGDILNRLDNTLADLQAYLKNSQEPDTVEQQATGEDFSKELPSLLEKFQQLHSSKNTVHKDEVDSKDDSESFVELKEEKDDDSDDTSAVTLKDVLHYLLQKQRKTRVPSAVKRDHDIPFPIDGTFSYDFRD